MFKASRMAFLARAAVLLTLLGFASGCGKNKVTKANLEKIKEGMTLSEVEAILGKGKKEEGDAAAAAAAKFTIHLPESGAKPDKEQEIYVWETPSKSITVVFRSGKVMSTSSYGF